MSARTDGVNHGERSPMRLAVIGAGYVGLVTAACLAHFGYRVTVLEVGPTRLRQLAAGRVPFHEPGLQELLAQGLANGLLTVSGEPAQALPGCDAILVCVGTPLDADGGADLSQIKGACSAIAGYGGGATAVMRSTLPIGSDVSLAGWLGRRDLERVATNPEFLRQGSAVSDFLAPTRVVIGTREGRETEAASVVRRIYAGVSAPILVTDYATADMIKNAANAFLAMKLSFINEVADLCESYGADVGTVARGIGLDPRIGGEYLRPGIGFGGSCLPKELANLSRLGRARGLPLPLIAAAGDDNDARAARTADRLGMFAGGLAGRRVALLGLAFKPHTDDLRSSPALALAEELLKRGARVVAHDPVVPISGSAGVPGLRRACSAEEACEAAELVVLATEWPEYAGLDWAALRQRVAAANIFDGRNILDPAMLIAAGWRLLRVGQAAPRSAPVRARWDARERDRARPPGSARAAAALG